jgi:hypothetical protein
MFLRMTRSVLIGIVAFLGGGVLTAGAFTAFPSKPTTAATKEPTKREDPSDLAKANQNLTESLQACDRKLDELKNATPSVVASAAPQEPRERDGGRFGGRRNRGEPTAEDWDRMAQLGTVRVRVPCVRDTPWTPNARAVERLGLAPDDTKALTDAYARSNKRVTDVVRPLCAKVLGSAEVADKVGVSACMDAIQNSARKASPENAKASLTHVAEVQAGKRPAAGAATDPLSELALALANESKAFESDLAQKLGPDDAKRIAYDPSLCSDRRTFRASEDVQAPAGN